jgi:hypothetical protein
LALAQFLYTHIDKSSRESIRQALSNEQDGIELLLHMHQHYGASNITDTYKAKEHLESTGNGSPVHTSITNLTQQLQSLEALELNNITQRQQQELSSAHLHHQPYSTTAISGSIRTQQHNPKTTARVQKTKTTTTNPTHSPTAHATQPSKPHYSKQEI